MNSKIVNNAQHIIDLRRYDAENTAVNNKIQGFEKDKEFKTLYEKYQTLMIENAKNGKDENEETIKIKALLDERAKKIGLTFTPQYTCPICQDNGRINGDYCVCLKKEINNILIKESGFTRLEKFENARFDIFDQPEKMKKLYSKMKEWCHSDFKKNIIYIAGETGVGKTHLMSCIANELINQNKICTLTSSFAMNQDFVKSYAYRNTDEGYDILDKYLEADILFIDDLGTELRRQDVTNNYLYLVINERKMKNKPTVITSNLTLEDVRDYYDERVFSRIVDRDTSVCIYLTGNDLRLKIK